MAEELDFIARYASARKFDLRPRTVFVEGTTDVELFRLAAKLEKEKTGLDLLGNQLAIIAAGERDDGGATGVCRELSTFKGMAKFCLRPDGHQKYRFIGLLDNDKAGQQAVKFIRKFDASILEFKDIFCIWPVMPLSENRDPGALQKSFGLENDKYKNLDWELEDLVSTTLTDTFLCEFPTARIRCDKMHDKVHSEWTSDGKARLHRFIRENASYIDLAAVIGVLRALWHYLNIKLPNTNR